MTAVLTNWAVFGANVNGGGDDTLKLDFGFTAMWIKAATSWLSALLYIWTLVAPLVMPDREFAAY